MLWICLLCFLPAALPLELSLTAGRLRLSLSDTSGDFTSLAVTSPSGKQQVLGLLPNSGTVLEGCSATDPAAIKQDSPGKIQLTRTLSCGTSTSVVVVESFSATATSTIRWETSLSSPAATPFSVPIAAALGFASWAPRPNSSTPRVWLGGSRSSSSPSVTNNPFEPWTIPTLSATVEHATAAGSSASFYVAKDYDAAYGCLGLPTCTPASPEKQPSATACQVACASHANCTIFAWNEKSQHCWFRLDNMWDAPGTNQPYPAISGCRSGSDPVSGAPFVPGCGPLPGASPHYWYGGQQNNIADPRQNGDQSSVLPILSLIDEVAGFGLSLVQSPQDTPIVAYSSVAATHAGGAWLNWTRLYHRFGHGAENISFSADLFVHGPCWRPAAQWTKERYPAFFKSKVSPERIAKISGTASYGDIRGPQDLSAQDASVYQAGAWALNWDSSARFPWHGEWAPTAADGFLGPDGNSSWLTCFTHGKPDGHFAEGCENVSFADLKGWYQHIRDVGSSSCQYGNLFEFGWDVASIWPPGKHAAPNCSAAAKAASNATTLLCHTRELLASKYGRAMLFSPTDPSNETGTPLCGGMSGSCIMDPHPDLPYLAHVLDMASTSIAKAPSSGVCIDRQDWLGHVNPNEDDRRTWLESLGRPVRAMIHSWKPAMRQFAARWHARDQAVIINDHSNRLDMMESVDGIYAEMGDMTASDSTADQGSLNSHGVGTALASLGSTVAYIWNHAKPDMTASFARSGLATHLWAGVFPTLPVKNNDHAIGGDCAPNCAYSAVFTDFGPLFAAIRSRQWALGARAATVESGNALANLFFVDTPATMRGGAGTHRRQYLAPVVRAPSNGTVELHLRGLDFAPTATHGDGSDESSVSDCSHPTPAILHLETLWPGQQAGGVASIVSVSYDADCDGGWHDGSAHPTCLSVRVDFDGRRNGRERKRGSRAGGNAEDGEEKAVLLRISCNPPSSKSLSAMKR